MNHYLLILLSCLCVSLSACASTVEASEAESIVQYFDNEYAAEKENLAESVGTQAYLYGAAIMTQFYFRNRMKKMVEISKQSKSALKLSDSTADGLHFNEIIHMLTKASHEMNIGGSANVDTRYSAMFFNLEHGAQVLHVPPIENRYFSINITDAYLGNRPYIGSRRGDTQGGAFLFTGPDFQGSIPNGVKQIAMPQNNFMVVIRIFGKDRGQDNDRVTEIQNQFTLESLDKYLGEIADDELHLVPSMPQVKGVAYFAKMVELMQQNLPEGHQDFIWNLFSQVGMSKDQKFDVSKLHPSTIKGLESGLKNGKAIIQWRAAERGEKTDSGWHYSLGMGVDHDNYMFRSEWAVQGLTVGSPIEALFFNTFKDSNGRVFDGSKKYTITIPANKMPPVNEFWSITSYGKDFNLIANKDYHYGVGSRDSNMKYNDDGSLTFLIQSIEPKTGISNWIPTAEYSPFKILFRFYNPKYIMLDEETLGDYLPPVMLVE